MRQDFNKLLCERERRRSSSCYREVRHVKGFSQARDLDEYSDIGGREGMKTRYRKSPGVYQKDFNENLNPLKSFLRTSVGRNWDKVYSEICSTFDKRSVINQHILIHLFQYVETKIIVGDDGRLKYFVPYDYYNVDSGWRDIKTGYFDYYVDPRDGRLCFNKNKKTNRQINRERAAERKAEEAKVLRVIDKENRLEKVNEIWYHVCSKEYDVNVRYFDYAAKLWKNRIERRVDRTTKQLNKKELKQYGVSNG